MSIGAFEKFPRKNICDVSKVGADLFEAGLVVRIFCRDRDFSTVLK